jgi:Alw26I/Eco31I/Esp3I family type II restriction m6 adenine DNA methyltransferase
LAEYKVAEDTLQSIAKGVLDAVAEQCLSLGLENSAGAEELVEVLRVVASNLAIAAFTGLSLRQIASSPDLGIHELSPRSAGFTEEKIWPIIERVQSSLDCEAIVQPLSRLSAYHFAKYLEAVHAITVYGDIEIDSSGVVTNGSTGYRKRRGAFYTPSSVARFICEGTIGQAIDELIHLVESGADPLDSLIQLIHIRVLDPACGPGIFLVEALRTIKSRYQRIKSVYNEFIAKQTSVNRQSLGELERTLDNAESFTNHMMARLYGVDLDPAAVEVASLCIAAVGTMPREDMKLLFLNTLKPGNSLVSEFPVRTIRRDNRVVGSLLALRNDLKSTREIAERKRKYSEFKDTVRELEKTLLIDFQGKRASSILDADGMMHAFCWELEFPEVFLIDKRGHCNGFDFVVMNPPYDILKLNRSEYVNPRQSPEERRLALMRFDKHKAVEKQQASFFRKSGQYKLSVDNVINLYRVMIERALQVTSADAKLGFIVPSTLICDLSARKLRASLLRNYRILGIDDFSEKAQVFEGVTQAVCVLRVDKAGPPGDIPIATHRSFPNREVKYYSIPLALVDMVSSDSMSIPRASKESWGILEKIHVWPRVGDQGWIVNRRGELDLTAYKQFISYEETGTNLIRGSHIGRYLVNWTCKNKECYVWREDFIRALGQSSKLVDIESVRIAGQQICNMAQKWRLKFGLVELGTILGNSCNYLLVRGTKDDRKYMFFLLALMNSHLLNWRFKTTSTNNHVNNRDLALLPVPNPANLPSRLVEIADLLSENAEKLVQKAETTIQHETEALVFRLYGLNKEEALTVLKCQGADEAEVKAIQSLL